MIATLLLVATVASPLQPRTGPDTELYDKLYTGCAHVEALVTVEDQASRLGVAEERRLKVMAESRLRAARLYPSPTPALEITVKAPALDITVQALDGDGTNAYTARVAFVRPMLNPITEGRLWVTTWKRGSFGYFGDRADPSGSVQANVSDFVDEFILDYLRVNEGSCD